MERRGRERVLARQALGSDAKAAVHAAQRGRQAPRIGASSRAGAERVMAGRRGMCVQGAGDDGVVSAIATCVAAYGADGPQVRVLAGRSRVRAP